MLVLSRKPGSQVIVANNIRITVLEIRGGVVKIGIEAQGRPVGHAHKTQRAMVKAERSFPARRLFGAGREHRKLAAADRQRRLDRDRKEMRFLLAFGVLVVL